MNFDYQFVKPKRILLDAACFMKDYETMKYTDEHLNYAKDKGVFSNEQIINFKKLIDSDFNASSKFQNILYYGGGLLIMSALTWLLVSNWDDFGAIGILIVSVSYLIVFLCAGYFLYYRKKILLPGGLLFCVAICVIPLLVFSIMRFFNFWPVETTYNDFYFWVKGKWIIIEIATILFALLVLLKTKFPFIVFIIACALWFMSMDIVPIIYSENTMTWTNRSDISQLFGIAMVFVSYLLDLKSKKRYSFWLYLFGLITITSGFSVFYNSDSGSLVTLLIVHLIMIILSLFLEQPVFIVFGMIGITEFLMRISYIWFKDSPVFPFLLTIIGLFLIIFGIIYQKNRNRINSFIINKIPKSIRWLRPGR